MTSYGGNRKVKLFRNRHAFGYFTLAVFGLMVTLTTYSTRYFPLNSYDRVASADIWNKYVGWELLWRLFCSPLSGAGLISKRSSGGWSRFKIENHTQPYFPRHWEVWSDTESLGHRITTHFCTQGSPQFSRDFGSKSHVQWWVHRSKHFVTAPSKRRPRWSPTWPQGREGVLDFASRWICARTMGHLGPLNSPLADVTVRSLGSSSFGHAAAMFEVARLLEKWENH